MRETEKSKAENRIQRGFVTVTAPDSNEAALRLPTSAQTAQLREKEAEVAALRANSPLGLRITAVVARQ